LDDNYGKYAALLLDGQIKAASDEYIIYVYDSTEDTELFNSNLMILEEVLEKSIGQKYKLIAVALNEWEKIKDEYNNKKRKYEYKEENCQIIEEEKVIKGNKEIDNLFDDIIEYTEEDVK